MKSSSLVARRSVATAAFETLESRKLLADVSVVAANFDFDQKPHELRFEGFSADVSISSSDLAVFDLGGADLFTHGTIDGHGPVVTYIVDDFKMAFGRN